MSKILTPVLGAIAVVAVLGNVFFYNRYSSSKPLVTIGDEAVTRKDYNDALEYRDAGYTIKKLVLEKLVNEEATRENVLPTDAEVLAREAELRRRSPQAVPDVTSSAIVVEQYERDLKTELALENLRMRGISATPEEAQAFYQKNRGAFVLPTQVELTLVVTKTALDANTAESDLRQGLTDDLIARQPRLHVVGIDGFNLDLNQLPANQKATIERAMLTGSPGDVKTFVINDIFLTIRIKRHSQEIVPPFSEVQDQAIRDVKLSKALPASVELAKIYQKYKPTFENPKYEQFFTDLEHVEVPATS